MGKAQFDREYVINKTVELFWKYGYNGSSMQQVVKATGLKPGSIYLAFGSKEGLYREAIESYSKKNFKNTVNIIESAPDVLKGIIILLEKMIEDSIKSNYKSCFSIKTQLEQNDKNLNDLAGEHLIQREVLIESYLSQIFPPELSKSRATSIMLHMYGLRVYGYHKQGYENIKNGLKEGLPWLPWD